MDDQKQPGVSQARLMAAITVSLLLLAGCLAACKKSEQTVPNTQPPASSRTNAAGSHTNPPVSLLQVHWLGKSKLLAETNAASLKAMWAMPETARLEAQILDKLAIAPWKRQMQVTNWSAITNFTPFVEQNPQAKLLRGLLADALNSESYFRLLQESDQSLVFTFSARIGKDSVARWQADLDRLLQSAGAKHIEGAQSAQARYAMTNTGSTPVFLKYVTISTNVDSITISAGAHEDNKAPGDFFAATKAPETTGTNYFLEVSAEPSKFAALLQIKTPLWAQITNFSYSAFADGADVRSRAVIGLAQPIPNLDPWNVPTNLITEPLSSFTAARQTRELLKSLPFWDESKFGTPPNQLFVVGKASLPFHQFVAFPLPEASNRVAELTRRIVPLANAWVATNAIGKVEPMKAPLNGVVWSGVPFTAPYLTSLSLPQGDFVMVGLMPNPPTNQPAPPELFREFGSRSNMVYYHWEMTGQRIPALMQVMQFSRYMLRKTQLPPSSASTAWLVASSNLLNAVSVGYLDTPNELTFSRRSTIGLTALELHLLADWFESPDYPAGLNTFDGPMGPPLPGKGPTTPDNKPVIK